MKKFNLYFLATLLISSVAYAAAPTETFYQYVISKPASDKTKPNDLKLLGFQNGKVVQHPYSSVKSFSKSINGFTDVRDYGVKPNDLTFDQTPNFTAALAAGSDVYIPAGSYRANITIVRSGTTLRGAGKTGPSSDTGGTFNTEIVSAVTILPWNDSLPAIQIGDGLTDVHDVVIEGVNVKPVTAGAGGKGVRILGVRRATLQRMVVQDFGTDNISIESSANLPTWRISLIDVDSWTARGSCLAVDDTSGKWITTIQLNNVHLSGYGNSAARSLLLNGAPSIDANNLYIDVPGDEQGHIEFRNSTAGTTIYGGANVHIDGADNRTVVTTNYTGYVTTQMQGPITVEGRIKRGDGSLVSVGGTGIIQEAFERRHRDPYIQGKIGFNAADADVNYGGSGPRDDSTPSMFLAGKKTGGSRVAVEGGGFAIPGTYTTPLQFGSGTNGASIWRNASSGHIYVKTGNVWPVSDTDGIDLTHNPSFTTVTTTNPSGNAIKIATGGRLDLGDGSFDYIDSDGSTIILHTGMKVGGAIEQANTSSLNIRGNSTSSGTAIAAKIMNTNALTTTGDRILVGYSDNGTVEKFSFSKDGVLTAGGGSTNRVVCWKSTGALGYCSAIVASDGSCGTCN